MQIVNKCDIFITTTFLSGCFNTDRGKSMFGIFGKKKKDDKDVTPVDRRRGQRRLGSNPRRAQIRWEPEREDRRKGDRRGGSGHWDDNEGLR